MSSALLTFESSSLVRLSSDAGDSCDAGFNELALVSALKNDNFCFSNSYSGVKYPGMGTDQEQHGLAKLTVLTEETYWCSPELSCLVHVVANNNWSNVNLLYLVTRTLPPSSCCLEPLQSL